MNKQIIRVVSTVLAAGAIVGAATASQFSKQSRTPLGPSLNKDAPTSSGPSSTSGPYIPAPAPAGTSGPYIPAPSVTPAGTPGPYIPAPSTTPTGAAATSTAAPLAAPATIMPTMPTTPQTPPQQTAFQPAPKPTAVERAGQMVRSVLQKIDPKATGGQQQGGIVDLSRSASPATSNTATAASAGNAAAVGNSKATAAPGAAANNAQTGVINTSMNKQERKIAPGAAGQTRTLQRGIMNEQRTNVGTVQ